VPQPIPDGFHTVTPFFVVADVAALVGFVERAFGAEIDHAMRSADGVIRHADVRIGNSKLMFSSGVELYAPRPISLHLYVHDVDAWYARALAAGARSLEAPADQFYGDRRAGVADEWDNHWWLATHVEDLNEHELRARELRFRRDAE
jgi:uncharacterized glyoxalase superfamily protein PhnB